MEELVGIHKVSDANRLYEAYEKSKCGSDWKQSVQKYHYNIWKNIAETQRKLNSGTYRQKPYVEFDINERGKPRHIKAIHISDRVVQRSLCDNVLTPATSKYLIYDNGASQVGKGIDFTRRRLEEHLHRYYRQYGDNEGYVILIDFKNYFGSIDHQKLIESYKRVIPEDDIIHLISCLINLNEGEFGLGIGAQLSQNAGIFFPSPLDQYFKVVKQQKYYGAYMDDRYIIVRTKEEAVELLYEFKKYAKSLNLVVNEKKTHIIKLSYGFTFLKFRYVLTDTGKVVTYQKNDTFVRERRRLKKFKKNRMSKERACECYRAWRGTVKRQKNNYYRICRMDKLFSELYPGVDFRTKKEVKEGKIIKFINQERKVA